MTNISSGQPRVSVNLDIANLPPDAPAYILREAATYGRIVVARAFADYRRNDLGDLPILLFQFGFQLIHCPSWPNGGGRLKSVVDSILAQDLRDQAEDDPTLEVFVLGSGDRDFMAVVHALRRHGRRVIIAATPDASNRSLVAGADGYVPLPMADRPERHERLERHERPHRLGGAPLPPVPQPSSILMQQPVTPLPPTAPPATPPPPLIQQVPPVVQQVPPVVQQAPPVVQQAPPVVQQVPPVVQQVPPQPVVQGHARQFHPEPLPSMSVLSEQILDLVSSRPQITARQVLQMLAPRNETGSARRRQAIGDAIATLVQQGKLVRRPDNVRGRVAEILSFPSGEPALPVAPTAEPAPEAPASPALPASWPQATTEPVAAELAGPLPWEETPEPEGEDLTVAAPTPPAPSLFDTQDEVMAGAVEPQEPEAAIPAGPEVEPATEPEAAKPRRRTRRRSRAATATASGDGDGAAGHDAATAEWNGTAPPASVETL